MSDDDTSSKVSPVPLQNGADSHEEGEDLNSTMMAIDVAKLNLGKTQTGVNIQQELSQRIAVPKKSSWQAFRERFFGSAADAAVRPRRQLPSRMRGLLGVWICDPNLGLAKQAAFYAFRLFLIMALFWAQSSFVGEIQRSFEGMHPARYLFLIGFAVQLVLVIVSLVLRASPGWILSLPMSVLAMIMAYGALFYHTADPLYFTLGGRPLSAALGGFYFAMLAYSMLASAWLVARNTALRGGFILAYAVCLVPVLVSFGQRIPLEYSFFGPGFLSFLPAFYLQPIYVVFHVVMPALVPLHVALSLNRSRADIPAESVSRGMARTLAVLTVSLVVLNFSLMQKNRVWHAFNLVFSKTLHVGGIEVKILNQNLKIETRNFAENEGIDQKARYRCKIEKSRDKGRYVLKIHDAFGFPVKYVTMEDLRVFSDDVEVKKYGFVEDDDAKLEYGRYLLTLPLAAKESPVSWPSERQSLDASGVLHFHLTDPAKVRRFVVKRDEDVLLDLPSPKNADVALPLSYFQTGAHKLSVALYDDLNQQTFRDEVNLSVKLQSDFVLVAPLPGDVVDGAVGVLALPRGLNREAVRSVRYFVDGKEESEVQGMNAYRSLDLSAHPDGDVLITVKFKLADREISHDVVVKKSSAAPRMTITEPMLGMFAQRDTPVALRVSDGARKIVGVKAWVNGMPFTDFLMRDGGGFDLPATRWEDSEIYLAVQATLDDGTMAGSWVQINRGMSELDLKFDTRTLNFLSVNKVALLLDASVSSNDNWQGQSKWLAMTNLIMAPEIESRLKAFSPVVAVFGNSKPYYFGDCDDAKIVSRGPEYNKTAIKRTLDEVSPRGVSALAEGLRQVYATKPGKVFVFADSADSCRSGLLGVLKPVLTKSPQTAVNIFSLGRVAESDRKQLLELAEKTGGRYFQPDSSDTLLKSWLEELSLNYELSSNDKQIIQSPLEDHQFRLGPGKYVLKIPYGNEIKEIELQLDHGTKTTLTVQGKEEGREKKIVVDQVVTQL